MTPTSAVVERRRSFRLTGRSSAGRTWGRGYGSGRVRGLCATALGQSGYRWGESVLRYAACTTLRSSVIVGLLLPGSANPDPDRSLDPCGYDPVADLHISIASGRSPARRKTHARYYTSGGFTRYEEWNQSI
jgi:hypothetical protein